MLEKGTIYTQEQLERIVREGCITDIHPEDLYEICRLMTEPARPSQCINWTENIAVPLIRMLADRIKYMHYHSLDSSER